MYSPTLVDGELWDLIDPVSPETAAGMQHTAILVLLFMLGIAGAHVAVAVLHTRTSWGRWLTAAVAAIYVLGALGLIICTFCERDPGAAPLYAVGGFAIAAVLLRGVRRQQRVSHE